MSIELSSRNLNRPNRRRLFQISWTWTWTLTGWKPQAYRPGSKYLSNLLYYLNLEAMLACVWPWPRKSSPWSWPRLSGRKTQKEALTLILEDMLDNTAWKLEHWAGETLKMSHRWYEQQLPAIHPGRHCACETGHGEAGDYSSAVCGFLCRSVESCQTGNQIPHSAQTSILLTGNLNTDWASV